MVFFNGGLLKFLAFPVLTSAFLKITIIIQIYENPIGLGCNVKKMISRYAKPKGFNFKPHNTILLHKSQALVSVKPASPNIISLVYLTKYSENKLKWKKSL